MTLLHLLSYVGGLAAFLFVTLSLGIVLSFEPRGMLKSHSERIALARRAD